MTLHRREYLRVTVDALVPGTTVRYHYGTGSSLATVVDRTDHGITFDGEDCDGTFTDGQVRRLLSTGQLRIVLGDAADR
ncbi:hypothetical protein [Halopiger djelfimassiliensis]|uniref:hypothetical protein n=1 Tax=Halopiger djelfimassiliensis TaxID=1293047 RepID=UPI0006782865|nr:hypothetical protein [Halopiger djelfimassiliensis]